MEEKIGKLPLYVLSGDTAPTLLLTGRLLGGAFSLGARCEA